MPLIRETNSILANQHSSNEVYLTSTYQENTSTKHLNDQTNTKVSNSIISRYYYDKMILDCPKKIAYPMISTISSKRLSRKYMSNNTNQNSFDTVNSSVSELPKVSNITNIQKNQEKTRYHQIFKRYVPSNHRNYTIKEMRLKSQLNLEELEMRSAGKGIFKKITQYRNIAKLLPFQLNQEDLLPSNYVKENKTIPNKVVKKKVNKKKVFENENEQMMRYRAKLRRSDESRKGTIKFIEKVAIIKEPTTQETMKEKMRDKEMINLMMQHGEKQLMYKLINCRKK